MVSNTIPTITNIATISIIATNGKELKQFSSPFPNGLKIFFNFEVFL